jgi:glycosyltransferase involved in cell wall biosynthesis
MAAIMADKVVIVMPAYNAARTIEETFRAIPAGYYDEIVVVDDHSRDDTVERAQALNLKAIRHPHNVGYGGNQKTCYIEALKDGADIVVMLHPDYQYDSRLVPELIQPIIDGRADLVLGSRFLGAVPLAGGMPIYKYVSNRFLTIVENAVLRQHLSECHTGFRAYSRRLLMTIPFLLNSDRFVFDTEVIAQTAAFGFKIAEIGVPTRYFAEASSVNFKNSIIYGLSTLRVMLVYALDRMGAQSPQFRKSLPQVLSRHHYREILASKETTAPQPGHSP